VPLIGWRVDRLPSNFGPDFCSSSSRPRREASEPVDSAGWAIQRVDECIVGCPCRFCPARNLGLHAVRLKPRQRRTFELELKTD